MRVFILASLLALIACSSDSSRSNTTSDPPANGKDNTLFFSGGLCAKYPCPLGPLVSPSNAIGKAPDPGVDIVLSPRAEVGTIDRTKVEAVTSDPAIATVQILPQENGYIADTSPLPYLRVRSRAVGTTELRVSHAGRLLDRIDVVVRDPKRVVFTTSDPARSEPALVTDVSVRVDERKTLYAVAEDENGVMLAGGYGFEFACEDTKTISTSLCVICGGVPNTDVRGIAVGATNVCASWGYHDEPTAQPPTLTATIPINVIP